MVNNYNYNINNIAAAQYKSTISEAINQKGTLLIRENSNKKIYDSTNGIFAQNSSTTLNKNISNYKINYGNNNPLSQVVNQYAPTHDFVVSQYRSNVHTIESKESENKTTSESAQKKSEVENKNILREQVKKLQRSKEFKLKNFKNISQSTKKLVGEANKINGTVQKKELKLNESIKKVEEELEKEVQEKLLKKGVLSTRKGKESRFKNVLKNTARLPNPNDSLAPGRVVTHAVDKAIKNATALQSGRLAWGKNVQLSRLLENDKNELGKALEPELIENLKSTSAVLSEYGKIKTAVEGFIFATDLILREKYLGPDVEGKEQRILEKDRGMNDWEDYSEKIQEEFSHFKEKIGQNYCEQLFPDIEEKFSTFLEKMEKEVEAHDEAFDNQTPVNLSALDIKNRFLHFRLTSYLEAKCLPIKQEARQVFESVKNDVEFLKNNEIEISDELSQLDRKLDFQMMDVGLKSGLLSEKEKDFARKPII